MKRTPEADVFDNENPDRLSLNTDRPKEHEPFVDVRPLPSRTYITEVFVDESGRRILDSIDKLDPGLTGNVGWVVGEDWQQMSGTAEPIASIKGVEG